MVIRNTKQVAAEAKKRKEAENSPASGRANEFIKAREKTAAQRGVSSKRATELLQDSGFFAEQETERKEQLIADNPEILDELVAEQKKPAQEQEQLAQVQQDNRPFIEKLFNPNVEEGNQRRLDVFGTTDTKAVVAGAAAAGAVTAVGAPIVAAAAPVLLSTQAARLLFSAAGLSKANLAKSTLLLAGGGAFLTSKKPNSITDYQSASNDAIGGVSLAMQAFNKGEISQEEVLLALDNADQTINRLDNSIHIENRLNLRVKRSLGYTIEQDVKNKRDQITLVRRSIARAQILNEG